jgi:hypothetical protein
MFFIPERGPPMRGDQSRGAVVSNWDFIIHRRGWYRRAPGKQVCLVKGAAPKMAQMPAGLGQARILVVYAIFVPISGVEFIQLVS